MRLFFVLILVASSAFARAQVLHGKVVDSSGAVVARAPILLINLQTLRTWQTHTGDQGEFAFHDLPKGKYEIKAVHPGFSSFSKRIKLKDAKTVKLRIELKIDPKTEWVEITRMPEACIIRAARLANS